MKILLPISFICLFVIAVSAQNKQPKSERNPRSEKSESTDLMLRMPLPEAFSLNPNDSLKYNKQPRFRLPERRPDQLSADKRKPADNMPIIRAPRGYFPPMPVYKPDTTIHYTLKIKKIKKP